MEIYDIMSLGNIILIGSVLLLVSIIAGKTSYRFGLPTLLLFLLIGMLAGSEGIGGINFDDPKLAQYIGVICLCFILFSGGLDTDWKYIRPIMWQGISLSTLGVLLTAVTLGVFVWAVTDFTIYEGLLLGAIVSSTDAAAVFSILRSKNIALRSNLRPTLEFESGSNDPMAYFLTIALLGMVVNQDQSLMMILPMFFKQMIIGALIGIIFAKASVFLINRIKLVFEGLYPVLVIALMFITFSAADVLRGNGFLAVYLCAVYIGNKDFIHKKTILKMFDAMAWLMQIILFLTLGLLVFPSQVFAVAGIGLVISIFLILVARPVSVSLSLLPFRIKFRKKLYISWVGLRGAVPIVFATFPLIAGIDKSEMIFNIVFFVSVTSVLIQGTTLSVVAKWLRVAVPERAKPKTSIETLLFENDKTAMGEIVVPPGGCAVGKKIVELNIPKATIITMIKRKNKYIIPDGSTDIQADDLLIILSDYYRNIDSVRENLCKLNT
jgi:potassium/hydrogen antiporter